MASFAVEVMVSVMSLFIAEEKQISGCREGLEGCPKSSSSSIMPLLFFHVVGLTQVKFHTLYKSCSFYFCTTKLHMKYTKICTIQKFATIQYMLRPDSQLQNCFEAI